MQAAHHKRTVDSAKQQAKHRAARSEHKLQHAAKRSAKLRGKRSDGQNGNGASGDQA
ncbi:hypothetical protein D3C74_410930 [compost metagenome]